MKRTSTSTICIVVILLALFIEEGIGRGGRGGGGRGGFSGRGSRGRGGWGGGGSTGLGGSGSGSASTGVWLGIVFGTIGGGVIFSLLVCLCVKCLQSKSKYGKSPGVVLNTPATRTINEPSLGMDLSRTTVHNTSAPPAYREVPQPIFNIQDEMTRNSNKGISQYYRNPSREGNHANKDTKTPKVHEPALPAL